MSDNEVAVPADASPEVQKPKKRVARTRKAATDESSKTSEAAPAAASRAKAATSRATKAAKAAEEDAEAPKAPAKRTREKASSKEKAADEEKAAATAEADSAEKKPVRRRTRKTASTEAADAAAGDAEKPKPRTRTRAKKTEEAAAAESAAATEAASAPEAEKPARATRRTAARKTTATASKCTAKAAADEGPAEKAKAAVVQENKSVQIEKTESVPAKPASTAPDQPQPLVREFIPTIVSKADREAQAAAASTALNPADQAPSDGDGQKEEASKSPDDSRSRSKRGAKRDDASKDEAQAEGQRETDDSAKENEQPSDRRSRNQRGQADGHRSQRKDRSSEQSSDKGGSHDRNSKHASQQGKHDRNDRNDRNGRHDRNDHRRQRRTHNQNREVQPSVTRESLSELKVVELRERATALGINHTGMLKKDLIEIVLTETVKAEGFLDVSGVLDIMPDGYGFLRTQGYLPSEKDCYVGLHTIRKHDLRKGDMVAGQTRPGRANERLALHKIASINDVPLEECTKRVRFGDLTPVYPNDRLLLEHGKSTLTARVIDLVAPIGKGQRGLIVSPPKAGKTTVLKNIAAAISANNPEVHLMCLLVDERPEEVTDMERSIKGEVISSTFDMPCENHIAVSELVIERAKRLVESGKDVVILLDSLTRLARAYNLAQPASGRILSGGVDSTALYPPKRFLGAARNIENGGSLTILASALVDTGSKMDEVIFEEFKGTGNMELKLDRSLAERRIFPAIDPVASGTRKEELLIDPLKAPIVWGIRRILANMSNTERAMDMLMKSLKKTDDNEEFLERMAKKAQQGKSDSSLEL